MVVRDDVDQFVLDALRNLTAGIGNESVAGLLFAAGVIVTDHVRRLLSWLPI